MLIFPVSKRERPKFRSLLFDALPDAASAWELQIKMMLAKLRLHGDPFDRLLIAQARSEKMMPVSADAKLREDTVEVLRS